MTPGATIAPTQQVSQEHRAPIRVALIAKWVDYRGTFREATLLESLRQYRRMLRGAGAVGRAGKLERRGRPAQARVSLLEALHAVEGTSAASLVPATSSTRLFAVTRLACIAASLKDHAEATHFAREGLALWAEARLAAPKTRDVQFFSE